MTGIRIVGLLALIVVISMSTSQSGKVIGPAMESGNLVAGDWDFAVNGMDDSSILHHRIKRQAPVSANMALSLVKTNGWDSKSEVKVGERVSFNLTITTKADPTDLTVEIYATSNHSSYMSICTPVVYSIGSNLNLPKDQVVVQTMKNTDVSATTPYKDRAVIEFGMIDNDESGPNAEDSDIVILFDALVHSSLAQDDVYYITAGATYDDGTKVWVGQFEFTGAADVYTSNTAPSFSFDAPTALMVDEIGVWKVDITLHDAATDVLVDFYGPLDTDGVISICGVSVVNSTGSGFGCLDDGSMDITYPNDIDAGNITMVTIDLGNVVNTNFRENPSAPDEDHTLSIEITGRLVNGTAEIGTEYLVGVVVELNTNTFWSSQIGVMAEAVNDTATPPLPSFILDTTVAEVPFGGSTSVFLNISIPPETSNTFYMEFALPFNGSAMASACELKVKHVGFNIPCTSFGEAILESEVEGSELKDYLIFDLGMVTNTGQRSGAEDSIISIQLDMKIVDNHDVIVDGDSVYVTAGVRFGSTMIWVGQTSVVVRDIVPEPVEKPTFELTHPVNERDYLKLYKNSSTGFYLDILLPASKIYPNITITAETTAVSDITPVEICRLFVHTSGANIPSCGDDDAVMYSAQNDDSGDYHKATLSLLNTVNTAEYYDWRTKNSSILRIGAVIKVNDRLSPGDGTDITTHFTVSYTSSDTWTGNITVVYTDDTPTLSPEDDAPELSLTMQSTTNQITTGKALVYTMDLYTTPRTISPFTAKALTSDSIPHMCAFRFGKFGRNVGCAYDAAEPELSDVGDDAHVEKGEVNLYNIANYADWARNETNKNHSKLEIEVIFTIPPDTFASTAHLAEHQFAYEVNRPPALVLGGLGTVVADTSEPVAVTNDSLPDPQLEWVGQGTPTITKGGGGVFRMKVYTPPGTYTRYYIEFYTMFNSSHNMSLCDARVMSTSYNIPCVNDRHYNHNKTHDNSDVYELWDTASVDMGWVHNLGENIRADVVDTKNMFVAEAVLGVPEESIAEEGDELSIGASLYYNDDMLWVGSMNFAVTESILPFEENANAQLEVVNSTEIYTVAVGSLRRYTMRIVTDGDTSSMFRLQVLLPTDVTLSKVYFNVYHAHVSFRGQNWVCGAQVRNVTYEPAFGTTQSADILIDMKVLRNAGTTHRYTFDDPEAEDDYLEVSFDLQTSEHPSHTDITTYVIETRLYYDAEPNTHKSESFTVNTEVTGTGTPDLKLNHITADLNITEDQLFIAMLSGEEFQIEVHFNHTWISTGHAWDVHVNLYLPSIIGYVGYEGLEGVVHTLSQDPNTGVLTFSFVELMFSDNITLLVDVAFDPNGELEPTGNLVMVSIPAEVSYKQVDMQNYPTPIGDNRLDMSVLEMNFTAGACRNPLGLEDGTLIDCQIVASSEYVNGATKYEAKLIRLNSAKSWRPANRGRPFKDEEYIQFNFGNKTRVTEIALQGPRFLNNMHVQTFRLAYSDDGLRWYDYMEKGANTVKIFTVSFESPKYHYYITYISLLVIGPIEARFLRFYPLTAVNNDLRVRLELYGCVISADFPFNDALKPECVSQGLLPVYERGYLANPNDGGLYICMVSNIDDQVSCSYTSDMGDSWQEIDPNVINIGFLRKDVNQIYGTARDRLSRLRSDDNGKSWCSIPEDEYMDALNEDPTKVVETMQIPFTNWGGQTAQNFYDNFGMTVDSAMYFSVANEGAVVWTNQTQTTTLICYWGDLPWS